MVVVAVVTFSHVAVHVTSSLMFMMSDKVRWFLPLTFDNPKDQKPRPRLWSYSIQLCHVSRIAARLTYCTQYTVFPHWNSLNLHFWSNCNKRYKNASFQFYIKFETWGFWNISLKFLYYFTAFICYEGIFCEGPSMMKAHHKIYATSISMFPAKWQIWFYLVHLPFIFVQTRDWMTEVTACCQQEHRHSQHIMKLLKHSSKPLHDEDKS